MSARRLLTPNGKRILYTLVPKDENGRVDVGKTRSIAQVFSIFVLLLSFASAVFYLLRLIWCYDNLPINEFYYGVIAAGSSQVAIECMSVVFSFLFVVGSFKRQTGFLFLWLVSALVLLSLGTLVTVYGSVIRDQSGRVPAIIANVALYKALTDAFDNSSEEREILL